MRKSGLRKGGDLLVFGVIGGAIIAGIYRLVTGHWPEHLDYAMWGLIAGSILTDAESYLTETLESTKGNNEKLRKVEGEIAAVRTQCETLNWKLDAFKSEFDEFVEESKTRES